MAKLQRSNRSDSGSRLAQLVAAIALVLGANQLAHAHISVDSGGTHMSRYSDDDMKDAPCGMTGGTRGTKIYEYKPGATINVTITETIPHPGYFRIAFDPDGDDGFVIPAGTNGESGSCSGDPKCGPGKEDFCNSDTVLLDNLDAHAAGTFGEQKKYTWSVTLPDIECDKCTLQIIQVMNDLNYHPAPYPADDIYYQCIDIVLSKSAPDVSVTPVTNNGMVCNQSPGTGQAGAGAQAGASSQAGAGGQAGAGAQAGASAQAGAGAQAGASGGAATAGTGTPVNTGTTAGSSAPANMPTPPAGTTGNAGGTPGAPTAGQMPIATAAGASAAPPPASESGGGCHVAGDETAGLFGPLVLALFALVRRRRFA